MKVLLIDTTNAFLTPGGKTTHALKLQQEISKLGVDIQFARWWDKSQEDADIVHFLGYTPIMVKQVKAKGMKTVFSMIFDFESNKSESDKRKRMIKNWIMDHLPSSLSVNSYWRSLPFMDRIQFMHSYDKNTALRYFPNYIDAKKTVIIPHAYDPDDMYIAGNLNIEEMHFPKKYLVSIANISERKQTVKLAKYAKKANVPIVFLGSKNDNAPYYQQFKSEIDNKYVFYPGYVSKEWKDCILQHSSGYVLLSLGESGCIAVYEAAAYKLPLLLSNLPWAWGYDTPKHIYYCDQNDEKQSIDQLREFYRHAKRLDEYPFCVHTWSEVASQYIKLYKSLMGGVISPSLLNMAA